MIYAVITVSGATVGLAIAATRSASAAASARRKAAALYLATRRR